MHWHHYASSSLFLFSNFRSENDSLQQIYTCNEWTVFSPTFQFEFLLPSLRIYVAYSHLQTYQEEQSNWWLNRSTNAFACFYFSCIFLVLLIRQEFCIIVNGQIHFFCCCIVSFHTIQRKNQSIVLLSATTNRTHKCNYRLNSHRWIPKSMHIWIIITVPFIFFTNEYKNSLRETKTLKYVKVSNVKLESPKVLDMHVGQRNMKINSNKKRNKKNAKILLNNYQWHGIIYIVFIA